MDYANIQKLKGFPYFTIDDLVRVLRIKAESAHVLCSRYVKKGIFVRLKNNFYILEQNWSHFAKDDFFKVSNYLQVPSYVSFLTALSFYQMTTQVPRDFFESSSIKRTARYDIKGVVFKYYKLKKEYYFGFVKKGDIFIATKEKALIDAIHLNSFGKYELDVSSIDFNKFDRRKIGDILKSFPERTSEAVKILCKI